MSETISTYGKTGSVALVVAGVVWAIAVAMGQVGSTPSALTRGIGLIGLALLVVGTVALVLMLIRVYAADEE